MIAKIHSIIPYGFDAKLVEVEGDMNRGLPAFNIVGMANKTINEAKERVRSAIVNSGFSFPDKKVTINLAPADLQKDGAYLDLPIALSIMLLSGQIIRRDINHKVFVGELSLDGKLRPVKGIINIVEAAKESGYKDIYVPIDNLSQASLVSDVAIIGVSSLQELYLILKKQITPQGPANDDCIEENNDASNGPFLDQILGQQLAKRAIEIAVAGHHNLLISGPPGAGKTLLARTAANLLPDLTPDEMIDITKIYSIAGLSCDNVIRKRPFRAPHHSASATSLIGGANGPGEISLAHKGILFLDEIPEFSRSVLESLRQPLEDRTISISRANQKTTYPADFMLIATMNPCPCGFLNDPTHECKCSELQIQNYNKKISGPLLDRIDMNLTVEKVDNRELRKPISNERSEHVVVKNTITEAIMRQRSRYGQDGIYNSSLSSFQVSQLIQLDPAAEQLLANASERLNLSARSYFKTIKVARTIADLEKSDLVLAKHLAEALTYRRR
ncbi:YifB family Mg chelatase-like AAA ATPase [Candidatus Saccharibacteria bacterium]|nr:YifB family Mg chelatase-like AAA ATPase [Candidatus Saccharibacteria bacterium]